MPFDGTNLEQHESILTKLLRKARALITKPENHLLGRLSNNGGTAFCALGAVYQVGCFGRSPVIALLAKHATYRGADTYNLGITVTDTSSSASKVAAHNNMLGHLATLDMFDAAIAESMARDMAKATS